MSDQTSSSLPSRWHRWRYALIALLTLPVLLVVLVLWVFLSASGRDWVLHQAQNALPPDSLSWETAEGALSGGLILHGVRYQGEGLSVQLDRLELDLSATALLTGDVHVRHLRLVRGVVYLPPEEAPAEPSWPEQISLPESLPDLVLPVAIRLDALQAQDLTLQQDDASLLVISNLIMQAELLEGRLNLPSLLLDSDRLGLKASARMDTARQWQTQLEMDGQLRRGDDAAPIDTHWQVKGDLNAMTVQGRADSDVPVAWQLQWQGGLRAPQWTLQLEAPALPADWLAQEGEPYAISLQGSGTLQQADWQGHVAQGGMQIELRPSTLRYRDTQLSMDPLALSLLQGEIEIHGTIGLQTAVPELALVLNWQGLQLLADEAGSRVSTQGKAQLDGPLENYTLALSGEFDRNGEKASVVLDGQGSLSEFSLHRLQAEVPGGQLSASGNVVWEPQLQTQLKADLQAFDPSYFVPDFPGQLDAQLTVDVQWQDDQPQGQVQLASLSGQLRGKALSGTASAELKKDGSGQGQMKLGLGQSRLNVEGRWGKALDAVLRLENVELVDIFPEMSGNVQGTIYLRGTEKHPQLQARLTGKSLSQSEHRLERLQLEMALEGWDKGRLDLELNAITLGDQQIDRVQLVGEGTRQNHRIELSAHAPLAALAMHVEGGLAAKAANWEGKVNAIQITPADSAAWQLRAPVAASYDGEKGDWSLDALCLDGGEALFCAQGHQQRGKGDGRFSLENISLAQFDALLSQWLEQPAHVVGALNAHGTFQYQNKQPPQVELGVTLPAVALRLDAAAEAGELSLSAVQLSAHLDAAQSRISLQADAPQDSFLRAELIAPPLSQADGEIRGQATLEWQDLASLALFSDQISTPSGRIMGRLAIAGTRQAPKLDGTLELLDFSAELPALGIAPRGGNFVLSSHDPEQVALQGRLFLGEGQLDVEGEFKLSSSAGTQGTLTLRGDNLTVMDTQEALVRASPDLSMRLNGNTLRLRGKVALPMARIDLERLESVAAPSSDVVIVDDAVDSAGLAVDTDISVILGDDIRMNGFGLKGTLAGQLRVQDRPGKATTARGSIDVGGRYKAYGQDLTITRGHVAYAGTPVENPALDIRAERKIDDITVGVQVRGTVQTPELSLWSLPVMEQAEQLSYLILGRPLRSASQAEGSELSQAAAAFGGNLLAKNLGAKLGLDEVEVADNRALGGAALTVGMHLSPRLHVSYGVALFGNGQVVTFKYLLSRLWNIQIDSGTENRAALNYRLER